MADLVPQSQQRPACSVFSHRGGALTTSFRALKLVAPIMPREAVVKPEIVSIRYRIPLSDAQAKKLRRTWPNGDPFYPYEKMEKYLEPLLVEDLNWHHYSGQYLYFTVYGDDIEGTLADALKVFEARLGPLEEGKGHKR